jgi:hypothetical protein
MATNPKDLLYGAWTLIWIAIASVIIYGLLYFIIGLLLFFKVNHALAIPAVCLAIAYVLWRRTQWRKEG